MTVSPSLNVLYNKWTSLFTARLSWKGQRNGLRGESHNRNLDEAATLLKAHEKLLRKTIGTDIQNPDDAEDVFQETSLKILEHFHEGKPVKHPKAWIVRIAKNECVNFQRQMQRDANRDTDLASLISRAAFGGGVSIADEQHQAVVVQEILDVIAEMGSIYVDVAKLWIEEYTAPEISEILGIAEGTVRSRLRKIRERVQAYLDGGPAEKAAV